MSRQAAETSSISSATLIPSDSEADNVVARTFLRARSVIERTDAHIAALRRRAAQRILKMRRQARVTGFAAGRRAALQQLARHAVERSAVYRDTIAQAERDCLEISLTVAREVVGRTIRDATALAPAIRRELELLAAQGTVNVRVHPSQCAAVAEALAEEIREGLITLSEDEEMAVGKCEFQTAGGAIFLDWEHTIDAVAQRCREKLRG